MLPSPICEPYAWLTNHLPRRGSQVSARGYKVRFVVRGSSKKLRLTTNFWPKNELALASPCGGGGMSRKRHAGEGSKNTKTMRGPAFRPAPARDPIFRDAMFLLFWCDQQQKVFHLSSHRKGCAHRQSLVTHKHPIIIPGYGAPRGVISKRQKAIRQRRSQKSEQSEHKE